MIINTTRVAVVCVLSAGVFASGCFAFRSSRGGGETETGKKPSRTSDVALLDGYKIELVAEALTFPTGITFDGQGRPAVVEAGYSYGEVFTTPRLLQLDDKGGKKVIAQGKKNGPWNGVSFAGDAFYIAEGGVSNGGKILRVSPQGQITTLVADLPSRGDHHSNGPIVKDGWVYFGQGTATNSGIVGPDNADFGWLPRAPEFHDVPCKDVVLAGLNYKSADALHPESKAELQTGAYLPFGTPSTAGQVVRGQPRCNGAIFRIPIKGGEPELVAWGLRNPYGLAFDKSGQLYATENAFDDRGSRPIFGAPDVLWRIETGAWYGWPDFAAGVPVSSALYETPKVGLPKQVLANHPNGAGGLPKPVAKLAVHSSSAGLDISHSEAFGFVGHAFIAQFGDQAPSVGKVWGPVGYKVVMVDLKTGLITDFAVNRSKDTGPGSRLKTGGLERPIAARFDNEGKALYVVDFGVVRMDEKGSHPEPETGAVWRITRTQDGR